MQRKAQKTSCIGNKGHLYCIVHRHKKPSKHSCIASWIRNQCLWEPHFLFTSPAFWPYRFFLTCVVENQCMRIEDAMCGLKKRGNNCCKYQIPNIWRDHNIANAIKQLQNLSRKSHFFRQWIYRWLVSWIMASIFLLLFWQCLFTIQVIEKCWGGSAVDIFDNRYTKSSEGGAEIEK